MTSPADLSYASRQRGFSLVELMVALVLGLLVVGGAGAVFMSNKRAFGTNATLNRIQESQRASFEIMSRDLREAGGNPCSSAAKPVNMLASGGNTWWSNYGDGLRGYSASETVAGTVRTAGTEAIDLALTTEGGGDMRVVLHDNPSANIQVSTTGGLTNGEILMICNMDYRMIFQVTNLTSAGGGFSIQHNGGGGTAGNCSQVFQVFDNVASCATGASGPGYCFAVPDPTSVNPNCTDFSNSPARVAHVSVARWYIGANNRGSTSLYRAIVGYDAATNTPTVSTPVEIAEGATGMAITYLRSGQASFEAPATVTAANAWGQVVAARVSITFGGVKGAVDGASLRETEANNANGAVISRTMTNVVTLRNREGLI